MMYDLPKSLQIGGVEREIRSDFRAILDICCALSDSELNPIEKAVVTLEIFYPDHESIRAADWSEALEKCLNFIEHGTNPQKNSTKLVDWEQDFPYIIGSINRTAGYEVRAVPYLHWWTFLSYFHAIGEGQFSTIVSIRDKLRRGKPLEKYEKEYYRENKSKVDLKKRYSAEEIAEREALEKMLS